MPRLRQDVRAARRQALIDAGWRCVARQGYRDLTVDDVCAEAGASKGTFYWYFAHKQELLLALLEDDAAALDRVQDDLEAVDLTSLQRLQRFAAAMLQIADEPARVQLRTDLWAVMLTDPAVRARFVASSSRRRRRLRSWVEAGIEAGEIVETPANAVAAVLIALGDGLLLHAALDPTAFRWANMRRAVAAMLQGLGPR